MLLVVAATDFELAPLQNQLVDVKNIHYFVAGMGSVETAMKLALYLSDSKEKFKGVINIGIGGAYLNCGLDLLDVCLANKEIFGDFGVCFENKIKYFNEKKLPVKKAFSLENKLLRISEEIFKKKNISYKKGTFLTVNAASGTKKRGRFLQETHNAICENMEGAAAARVCEEFGIDFVEVRCVSNLVIDHGGASWKISEACRKLGDVTAKLVKEISLLQMAESQELLL